MAAGVGVACVDRLRERSRGAVTRGLVRPGGEPLQLGELDDVRAVEPHAVLAVLLGPVQGAVGEPDQLVSTVTLHRERRETRADGDLTDVVEVDGRDPLDDRLRRGQRRRLVMVGEQQRELVSSEAERLSALTEPRRDLREHAVPRRVSEAVVDPLEVVDVHQAERQRACLLFGVQQLALQSLVEVAVVAEAGEGIREREPHRAERAWVERW